MLVAGGSSASVVLHGGFANRLRQRRGGAGGRRPAAQRAVRSVLRVVERGHIAPALERKPGQEIRPARGLAERVRQLRHENLALAGGDDVRKEGERFGIDERHGAADDDERMAGPALCGV